MIDFFPLIIAHVLPGDVGIIQGFLHPLLGLEHLLAMVAVGLVSALIGDRAIWTIPLAFVVMMSVGGIVGFFGMSTPLIEYGIAFSLILLGIMLVVQKKLPEAGVLLVVGIFALFHGYAHGEAVPIEQTVLFFVAYVLGFVMSTAGLHVIGALLGYIALRSDRGTQILRGTGVMIAAIGVFFVYNLLV